MMRTVRAPLIAVFALILMLAFSTVALAAPAPGGSAGLIKVTHIHYVVPPASAQPFALVPGAITTTGDTYYKLLSYRWPSSTTSIPFVFNSTTVSTEYQSVIKDGFAEWGNYSAKVKSLFSFSAKATAVVGGDGKNQISFDHLGKTGVLAITTSWISRATKKVSETDIQFNTDYAWGIMPAGGTYYDVQNVATHEIGHVVGLNDIYQTRHNTLTMYGYSGKNETSKDSLELGDQYGEQAIWGK